MTKKQRDVSALNPEYVPPSFPENVPWGEIFPVLFRLPLSHLPLVWDRSKWKDSLSCHNRCAWTQSPHWIHVWSFVCNMIQIYHQWMRSWNSPDGDWEYQHAAGDNGCCSTFVLAMLQCRRRILTLRRLKSAMMTTMVAPSWSLWCRRGEVFSEGRLCCSGTEMKEKAARVFRPSPASCAAVAACSGRCPDCPEQIAVIQYAKPWLK